MSLSCNAAFASSHQKFSRNAAQRFYKVDKLQSVHFFELRLLFPAVNAARFLCCSRFACLFASSLASHCEYLSRGSVVEEVVSELDSLSEEEFVLEVVATNFSVAFLVLLPCKIRDWSGWGLWYFIPLLEFF